MSIHFGDSQVHGHLWATEEGRSILEERARLESWLEILATLAEAQAALGLIPATAAGLIRQHALIDQLDLGEVAAETRASGHSTLGLIKVLRTVLPEDAGEWIYYGATVQDLTDTWFALTMKRISDAVERDLGRLLEAALRLASEHRATPMLGRTHAQPGLPITFGYKAAVWAVEIDRHRKRLSEGRPRWELAQLGGSLGILEFWGENGAALLEEFAQRLHLGTPLIPWLTARDGVAEFSHLMAMISSTLAKIGNEVMELQRPELGELAEPFIGGTVGSITMPQKHNPELSEHLDTLARLIRADAGVVTAGLVQLHERDGRAWKAEWIALPEICAMTLAATGFAITLLEGLVVNATQMEANIASRRGYVFSGPVMRALADRIGKHTAHEVIFEISGRGMASGATLLEALEADPRVSTHFDHDSLAALFKLSEVTGSAVALVDRVLESLGNDR